MEHVVAMPALPPGIVFPADLASKIRHESATGRLVYRGFMSKSEFDRLCRLSDDWAYRRPLEELFRMCTPEEPRRPVLARLAAALHLFGF